MLVMGITVRLRRSVGACAAGVLVATLTLTAVVGVSPVGAQEASPEDIANRLVQSVAGYVALPEGDSGGMTSGPTTPDELAGIVGADISDPAVGSAAGYMRVFGTPAGDSTAIAIGIDTGGVAEAADFLAGIQHAAAAAASAMPLFPGEQPPLGEVVAYEVTDPGSSLRVAVTAIASNSIGVVLAVRDATDNIAVLRQMVRDQAALTPPTRVVGNVASASPDSPRTDAEEETVAYRLGQVVAMLAVVGVAVWLIFRPVWRRRRPAPAHDRADAIVDHSPRRPGLPLPPLDPIPPSSSSPPPPAPPPPRR